MVNRNKSSFFFWLNTIWYCVIKDITSTQMRLGWSNDGCGVLPLCWMTSGTGGVGHLSSTMRRGEGGNERSEGVGSFVRMLRLSDRAGFSLAAPVPVIFWWYLSIIRRMLGAVVRTAVVRMGVARLCWPIRFSSVSSDDLELSSLSGSFTASLPCQFNQSIRIIQIH